MRHGWTDALESALQKLIADTEKPGFVTYSQINDALSPTVFDSREIEEFLAALDEKGIRIVEDSDDSNRSFWLSVQTTLDEIMTSSAPHIHNATTATDLKDWGDQPDAIEGRSHSSGLLLHKSPDGSAECGLWVCTPGAWRLSIPGDELCYFLAGRATYTEHNGETIEVTPGTVVHFPSGWTGRCDVHETMRNTYILSVTPATIDRGASPVLRHPESAPTPADWGPVPTMIEGQSVTSGRLLYKGPGGRSETGIWVCTPGYWNCHVTSDEYCHFLSGRSTYVHESGEIIEIRPDTVAFFPKDWKGTCRVHETVRKVYMIR